MTRLLPPATFVAAVAIAAALSFNPLAAKAQQPRLFIHAPHLQPAPMPTVLPTFGFQSRNLHGLGEQVVFVHCGSIAARLGLEPGDVVVSLNEFPLTYCGAWQDALRQAMLQGGLVHLDVRDIHTGRIAHREIFLGTPGVGPVTPKSLSAGPVTPYSQVQPRSRFQQPAGPRLGQPVGPTTLKSQGAASRNNVAPQNLAPQNRNLSPPPRAKANASRLQQVSHLIQMFAE